MITHEQNRAVRYLSSMTDRIDCIPDVLGTGPAKVHMWDTLGAEPELIAVATVQENGEWEMHTPSDAEYHTIKPIPEESE